MTAGPRTVVVPELSLVVLIGVSGSGKSTFARRHFAPTQVLSSDTCRGLVADDENDQSATPAAFALLHHIAGIRLRGGRLTVVDATNVKAEDRASLVRLAREHDVLPVAIVLDVPEGECLARNALRPDRDLAPGVVRRQRADLRRGLRGLGREGFRKVHVLDGTEEIERAVVTYEKQYNDRREDTGPFDVIGDVHGCRTELEELLGALGYDLRRDDQGRPVDAEHPAGRRAVFVGDLVDRGPDSPGVLRLVMGMVAAGHALCVPGNHEAKLVRALRGRNVQVTHGLERTLAQLEAEDEGFRRQVEEFCSGWSATTSSAAGPSSSRTPGSRSRCRAAPAPGCGPSRSTARRRARPTSSACRCATPGRPSTAAARRCSTGTPRCPRRSG